MTDQGRKAPVEAQPITGAALGELAGGAVLLVPDNGPALTLHPIEAELEFDDARYTIHVSHFARCPFAKEHRGGRAA